jgi:hypothetical protein
MLRFFDLSRHSPVPPGDGGSARALNFCPTGDFETTSRCGFDASIQKNKLQK